jgi:UDP-glucose 4-epimerase
MRKSDSTVLVTGGLGFIGCYVVRDLLARGWRVRAFDNCSRSDPASAAEVAALDGVEVIQGDVRYANSVEEAVRGVEAVVHLAAVCINKSIADPTESLDVNVMGTQNVLDAAAREGVSRFVYASSASVYGDPDSLPIRETDPPNPITPYCAAKLTGEYLLSFYAQRSNLSWLALRFFNVYGAGQSTDAYYTSVILSFLRRIAAGEPPLIDGRGDQSMDFVHVSDVARAVGDALDSAATGQVLNVGTGEQTTITQLAETLIQLLGHDVRPQFRPREVLVSKRQADIGRIAEVLGWYPRIDLEEGLSTVVDAFKHSAEFADHR